MSAVARPDETFIDLLLRTIHLHSDLLCLCEVPGVVDAEDLPKERIVDLYLQAM